MSPESLTAVRARRLEVNSKVLELAAEDDLTEDQDAEFARLTGELRSLTKRESAMVAAGADQPDVVGEGVEEVDKEAAEFAKLVDQADLGQLVASALSNKPVAGAMRELQQESGVGSLHIPPAKIIEAFAASTVTSDGDQAIQEPTIQQVFASIMTEMLGVDRQMTGVGVVRTPVVDAPEVGPTSTVAVGTAADDSTVTISAPTLTPHHIPIPCTFGKDEGHTFRNLGAEVETVLRDAGASAMDYQALYAAADQGILNHGTDPTADTTVETFATLWSEVADAVDGRYARRLADLCVLVGPATYRLASGLYRGATADSETVVEKIDRMTAGIYTSSLVADPASDDQQAVVVRGAGMHTGIVQRIWDVELIPDSVTLATSGQIRLTLSIFMATAVVRAGIYRRFDAHLA